MSNTACPSVRTAVPGPHRPAFDPDIFAAPSCSPIHQGPRPEIISNVVELSSTGLPPRQRRILAAIQDWVVRHGYSPSTRQITDSVAVPVVGDIAAGSPVLAEEHTDDILTLPRDLIGRGTLFDLRVRDDSMVDAAICDGDIVVVRQQPEAQSGEIVHGFAARFAP